jgi:hypothetical protein
MLEIVISSKRLNKHLIFKICTCSTSRLIRATRPSLSLQNSNIPSSFSVCHDSLLAHPNPTSISVLGKLHEYQTISFRNSTASGSLVYLSTTSVRCEFVLQIRNDSRMVVESGEYSEVLRDTEVESLFVYPGWEQGVYWRGCCLSLSTCMILEGGVFLA